MPFAHVAQCLRAAICLPRDKASRRWAGREEGSGRGLASVVLGNSSVLLRPNVGVSTHLGCAGIPRIVVIAVAYPVLCASGTHNWCGHFCLRSCFAVVLGHEDKGSERRQRERGRMKAINLLKRQHRQNERLFKQIQRSKEEAERTELMTQLATALAAHMAIEEQFLYPAAQQVLSGKKAIMGETPYLEHMNAKMALQTVLGKGPMSFEARLKVLRELVEHHVQEEEEVFLPELEALMDDAQMKTLGTQMQQAFEQMEALGFEGIMAQDMQAAQQTQGAQGAQGAQEMQEMESSSGAETASSGGKSGSKAASKSRANGASGRPSKSGGRSQARA